MYGWRVVTSIDFIQVCSLGKNFLYMSHSQAFCRCFFLVPLTVTEVTLPSRIRSLEQRWLCPSCLVHNRFHHTQPSGSSNWGHVLRLWRQIPSAKPTTCTRNKRKQKLPVLTCQEDQENKSQHSWLLPGFYPGIRFVLLRRWDWVSLEDFETLRSPSTPQIVILPYVVWIYKCLVILFPIAVLSLFCRLPDNSPSNVSSINFQPLRCFKTGFGKSLPKLPPWAVGAYADYCLELHQWLLVRCCLNAVKTSFQFIDVPTPKSKSKCWPCCYLWIALLITWKHCIGTAGSEAKPS